MILVGQFDSPVTRRIGITLRHYGLPFSRDTRSVFSDATGVAKISPMTRIPALVLDNGEVLVDSSAILDHLDEIVGPERALVPREGAERRRILQACALAMGVFEKTLAVFYERLFHPAEAVSRVWESRCLSQLAAGLVELERRAEGPWSCGARLSHADVMLTCAVGFLRLRLPEALPASLPRLSAIVAACEDLPAFRAAAISPEEAAPPRR